MRGIDYLRLDKNRDKAYAFDVALDTDISQQEVYECTTKDVVPGVVKGVQRTGARGPYSQLFTPLMTR
jgi:hypothetical protein